MPRCLLPRLLTVSLMSGEVSPGPGQRPVLTVVAAHHRVKVRSHSVLKIVARLGLRGRRGGGGKVVRIVRRWRRMRGVEVRSCHPHQLRCIILDNLVHHTPGGPAVDRNKTRIRVVLDWHQVRRASQLRNILKIIFRPS